MRRCLMFPTLLDQFLVGFKARSHNSVEFGSMIWKGVDKIEHDGTSETKIFRKNLKGN